MSAIYFFPGDDVPTWYKRDAKGVVRAYGGDDTPEDCGDVRGMCVFDGTVHRVADLTDEQLDEMGASRSYDEWWSGHFRPATDAEILAVFSHAESALAAERGIPALVEAVGEYARLYRERSGPVKLARRAMVAAYDAVTTPPEASRGE
jgi:hypothetical protein